MRTTTTYKTMKTACGKTIAYMQITGENAKPHSLEGPAIIYPESEGTSPEYYINGIKYSKADWQSLVAQDKVLLAAEPTNFDF
jgi:hypothetical protein